MIFNGEIYTYLELREDLKEKVTNLKHLQIQKFYCVIIYNILH